MKGFANVLEFRLVGNHVEDDGADAFFREAAELRPNLRVTADQVGAIRLKCQKRQQPVTVFLQFQTESVFPMVSFNSSRLSGLS